MASVAQGDINQARLLALEDDVDHLFYVLPAIIIFFMQAGFALVEAGCSRSKNVTNVLLKNLVGSLICGFTYWIFGYALAFGKDANPFCGSRYWAGESLDQDYNSHWFLHYTYAAVSVAIVSGALAERCSLASYYICSFIMSGFIYPIVSHWGWDKVGWMKFGEEYNGLRVGYQDTSGAGIVHLLGGFSALVGAAILGPRVGRFRRRYAEHMDPSDQPTRGHSVPLITIGTCILFFGFLPLNAAMPRYSSDALMPLGKLMGTSLENTIISASFSALTGIIITKIAGYVHYGEGKWSLLVTLRSALAGMVAISAGCDQVHDWGAAAIGFIAGLTYLFWSWAIRRMRVDDPVDAFAIHAGAGFWGLVAQPILKRTDGIVFKVRTDQAQIAWLGLGWNLAGAASIIAWTGVICIIMFGLLTCLRILRVSEEFERRGLDIPKHHEPAYPRAAYGHGWSDYDRTFIFPELDMVDPEFLPKDIPYKAPRRPGYGPTGYGGHGHANTAYHADPVIDRTAL